MDPVAHTIVEAAKASRVGRTSIYEVIRRGELRAVKVGRRTLILAEDLMEWLRHLPVLEGKTPSSNNAAARPNVDQARGACKPSRNAIGNRGRAIPASDGG